MKRVILVIILYTAILFGACVGISFLYGNLPLLLDNAIKSYTFFRGLYWFLTILPAVLISGFMIGCAIQWRSNTDDSREKFSPAMVGRYKKVLGISIVITCLLTFSAEIFLPGVENHQTVAEENPALLAKYITLGKTSLDEGHDMLAWQYAEQAYAIYPNKPEVAALYKKAKDAKDLSLAAAASNPQTVEKVDTPIKTKNNGYTILEMIEKSKQAASEKKWIDAHYWATLAVTACNGTNTNLSAAQEAANNAWNELNNPVPYDNTAENTFFAKKKEGYKELAKGNDLKAYYLFSELSDSSSEYSSDPDVETYLAIAKERVESQYFFIDETTEVKKIESTRNIYFSLMHNDGSFDVIYVRGIATLNQAGNVVRYLDGLTMVSFDSHGKFVKSMSVPFAKMLEQQASVFTDEQKAALGIPKDTKTLPFIQLQSVDRTTEGIVSRPQYSYTLTDLPNAIAERIADETWFAAKKKQMQQARANGTYKNGASVPEIVHHEEMTLLLPMPYEDFDLLNDASNGAERMSFLSLIKFVPKSVTYGFAQEVFSQNLVRRGAYPLFLLILLVFAASFAWNYRVGEHDVFKFKWLFLFPVFTAVVYLMLDCCQYLFTLLNYVFVGTCGPFALIVAFVVYVLVFFFVSLHFMARRSS
jgi:hypothetical protein